MRVNLITKIEKIKKQFYISDDDKIKLDKLN